VKKIALTMIAVSALGLAACTKSTPANNVTANDTNAMSAAMTDMANSAMAASNSASNAAAAATNAADSAASSATNAASTAAAGASNSTK
jgi:hypothetical protein